MKHFGHRTAPLPAEWRTLLAERLAWWPMTDPEHQTAIEQLVMRFLATKRFEPAKGFTLSEDIAPTIAADACLLIVGLDLDWYRDVSTVIVYPSVAIRSGTRRLDGGLETEGPAALAGEAMLHGPIMIAWDQAIGAARHPELGHNVVFHEFAHKLDMANGGADGTPRLPSREVLADWQGIMREALADLRQGRRRFIDTYGATGPSELFAVVTEAFFTVPRELRSREHEIYTLLKTFYRQDPANW